MKHPGPLAGVRVIDLTAMVMGPYCTQIMADMGADVIKVEPPAGDTTRYVSAAPEPGMGGVFVNVNRGKRSMVLDLRSGAGQDALRALVAFMLVEHANGALFSPPLGPAAYPRVVAPNRKPYRTRDGYISALVYNDKQWAAFAGAVKPPWAGEHLATLEQRVRQIDAVYALLAETFAERTTQDWLDLLRSLDIPAAPVRTLDELFGHPHLNEAGFFETVDTPNGPVRFPGPPAWFSKTPGRIAGPAPRLGAHTAEVMNELGDSSPT